MGAYLIMDMGLIPGERVSMIKYAPMGDPMELRISGYELTLRKADAAKIKTKDESKCSEKDETDPAEEVSIDIRDEDELPHPGIGEGKPDDIRKAGSGKLTFALAGNQNCGKTTLFNALTGSDQHVGNFPGVTVDRKSGTIIGHPETEVVDLPGIYSLSPYSGEERVSREYILKEKPSAIINIIDATNIERNMYLTMQLMELGIPMVLAINMMDELRGNGGSIRINEMEQLLGIPVIPISAAKHEGIEELVNHALHVAENRVSSSS